MKFPYKIFPAAPLEINRNRKSIRRPVIPIHIKYKNNLVGCEVLIDSGADYCMFDEEIAQIVGIDDIKNAPKIEFSGVTGDKATAYFHHIRIKIGGWEYPLFAGFVYNLKSLPYGILGQEGFFNLFKIEFDLNNKQIELKPKRK